MCLAKKHCAKQIHGSWCTQGITNPHPKCCANFSYPFFAWTALGCFNHANGIPASWNCTLMDSMAAFTVGMSPSCETTTGTTDPPVETTQNQRNKKSSSPDCKHIATCHHHKDQRYSNPNTQQQNFPQRWRLPAGLTTDGWCFNIAPSVRFK